MLLRALPTKKTGEANPARSQSNVLQNLRPCSQLLAYARSVLLLLMLLLLLLCACVCVCVFARITVRDNT
jgi:hypothetical protein